MDWFRNNRPLVVSSACLVYCLLSAAHVFALYSSPAVFMQEIFRGGKTGFGIFAVVVVLHSSVPSEGIWGHAL